MGRLDGKKVFMTASGQGIGRASALACSREGATVYATDINAEPLAQLKHEDRSIRTQVLDVRDGSAIERVVQEIGPVDVLFNCAGFVHHGTILDCDESDWDFSFDLNVKSMYRVIRAWLPTLIEAGGASIINMSSVASSIKGAPNRFVYGASKGAVIGLTRALAADFVGQGIRCNVICPGTVHTPSLDDRIAAQGGDPSEVMGSFIARQPMGRIGTAEELAHLVVYLAADESSYTTGTVHIIDGGWSN